MFVFMSVVVTVWGSDGMFYCISAVVKNSVFGMLKYAVCVWGCDGCCVF